MAVLRSIGSSLVAKASPGAAYRDAGEAGMENPVPQDAGQVGSLSRSQVEQPLERSVPEGSSKVVAVKPLIEGGIPGDVVSPGSPTAQSQPGVPGGAGMGIFAGQPGVVPAGVYAPTIAPQAPGVSQPQPGGGGGQPNVPTVSQPSVQTPRINAPQATRPSVGKVGLRSIVANPNQLRSQNRRIA